MTPTPLQPGERYGNLTAVRELPRRGRTRYVLWRCECKRHVQRGLSRVKVQAKRGTPSCGRCLVDWSSGPQPRRYATGSDIDDALAELDAGAAW